VSINRASGENAEIERKENVYIVGMVIPGFITTARWFIRDSVGQLGDGFTNDTYVGTSISNNLF